MTKRIIDGMSADQIADGAIHRLNYKSLLDYLESICKPEPTWSDDASKDTPILCWVSDSPLPKSDGKPYFGVADYVTGLFWGYMSVNGHYWNYARPVSPNECWQPAQRGA